MTQANVQQLVGDQPSFDLEADRTSPAFQDFLTKVSSFVEIPSESDVQFLQVHPQLFRQYEWKCKRTPEYVSFRGLSERAINRARAHCSARDDTHIEPVGGKGGYGILDAIPDDFLPETLHQQQIYQQEVQQYRIDILALSALLVIIGIVFLVWLL